MKKIIFLITAALLKLNVSAQSIIYHQSDSMVVSINTDESFGNSTLTQGKFEFNGYTKALYASGLFYGNKSKKAKGNFGSFNKYDFLTQLSLSSDSSHSWYDQVIIPSQFATKKFITEGNSEKAYNINTYFRSFFNKKHNYFIMKYILVNKSDAAIDSFHVGLFADWDIGHSGSNMGGIDTSLHLAYMYDNNKTQDANYNPNYYGILSLDKLSGATISDSNITDISASAISLIQTIRNKGLSTPADHRMFIGSGPYKIVSNQNIEVSFAVLAAKNLNELKAQALIAIDDWKKKKPTFPETTYSNSEMWGTISPDSVKKISAEFLDISGLKPTLSLTANNEQPTVINSVSNNGSIYDFKIPPHFPGTELVYQFQLEDSLLSRPLKTKYGFISGSTVGYPTNEFVKNAYQVLGSKISKIAILTNWNNLDKNRTLVKAVIGISNFWQTDRVQDNIISFNHPNDSVYFNIWSDENGIPGTELIPPKRVKISSDNIDQINYLNGIIVDLTEYHDILKSYSGNIHVGLTLKSTDVVFLSGRNSPVESLYGKTQVFDGQQWINPVRDYFVNLVTSKVIIDNIVDEKPRAFQLGQNYPNPFNPSTIIEYELPKNSQVQIKIFDLLGREVKSLVNEEKPAGKYKIEFNSVNLSSGIYLYQLQTKDFKQTRKFTLVR